MSLIDVCYEQIKGDFWWGIFGDFKLIVDKSTGHFNATKLCASGGKLYKNWSRLEGSKTLIDCVEKAEAQICAGALYEITGDNKDNLTHQITGTYVHKKLILAIACWISPDFYFKCEEIVRNYYTQDFIRIKEDHDLLQDRLEQIEESLTTLSLENQKLKITSAPYTKDPALHNCFLIIRKNTSDEYPYYCIRSQKRNLKQALKNIEKLYPNFDIIYNKDKDPNSVKLFRLMIEELPIETKCNSFKTILSEEEMIDKIDGLYDSLH